MILKKTAQQRKKKAQLLMMRQEKEQENRHIKYLIDAESMLAGKRLKLEDAVTAITENENMLKFMKEKGLVDEHGNVAVTHA